MTFGCQSEEVTQCFTADAAKEKAAFYILRPTGLHSESSGDEGGQGILTTARLVDPSCSY